MVFFPFCVPPCFVFLLHFFVCPSFFFFFFLHSVVLLAVFPYYIIHNGRLFPGFAAVAGYMSAATLCSSWCGEDGVHVCVAALERALERVCL